MWAQKPDAAEPSSPAKGDPDWAEPEPSANGEGAKKGTPAWAATVPSSPCEPIDVIEEDPAAASAERLDATPAPGSGEVWSDTVAGEPAPEASAGESAAADEAAAEAPPADVTAAPASVTAAPLTEPPRAVAADALKSTWPPRAEAGPAPPEETDIWPPEPPTERAMPAWPPPSELEEPETPAQAIPSWPESFDSAQAPTPAPAPPAPQASAPPKPADVAPTVPPANASQPAATVKPVPPAPEPAPDAPRTAAPPPTPPAPVAASEPPLPHADTTPPTEPETIPPAEPAKPVSPAAAAPSAPAWAPSQASNATPAPAQPGRPSDFQVPAWAPRVPLAAEPGTPTWFSPKEQVPHATSQPAVHTAAPQPPPAPAAPVVGGQLPVAPVPAPAPDPPAGQSNAPGTAKPTWQVVEQAAPKKAPVGPTAEDRSYAEWFSWAKRGGAPASACHAAAQGAFKALSSGKDVSTEVQWATAAMSRPPETVSYARQQYCAWFALANIDLNFDQPRAHAFAGAAVQALDAGADASAAHAAGLAAAGIR